MTGDSGASATWATPGHCVNIDGEWWHDQGRCSEVGCNRRCCGPAPSSDYSREV